MQWPQRQGLERGGQRPHACLQCGDRVTIFQGERRFQGGMKTIAAWLCGHAVQLGRFYLGRYGLGQIGIVVRVAAQPLATELPPG
jgi:hypothetical protein